MLIAFPVRLYGIIESNCYYSIIVDFKNNRNVLVSVLIRAFVSCV